MVCFRIYNLSLSIIYEVKFETVIGVNTAYVAKSIHQYTFQKIFQKHLDTFKTTYKNQPCKGMTTPVVCDNKIRYISR